MTWKKNTAKEILSDSSQLMLKDTNYDRSSRDKDERWSVSFSNPNVTSHALRTYQPSKALLMAAKKIFGGKFSITLHFSGSELEDITVHNI